MSLTFVLLFELLNFSLLFLGERSQPDSGKALLYQASQTFVRLSNAPNFVQFLHIVAVWPRLHGKTQAFCQSLLHLQSKPVLSKGSVAPVSVIEAVREGAIVGRDLRVATVAILADGKTAIVQ